jgi:hypothetical protein
MDMQSKPMNTATHDVRRHAREALGVGRHGRHAEVHEVASVVVCVFLRSGADDEAPSLGS